MMNLIRPKGPRTARRGRPAAAAVAVAALAAAGVLAGQGSAAPAARADAAPDAPGQGPIKAPKLKHGELKVDGTEASDTITLRLQAGQPDVVQVDLGDESTPVFSFPRDEIAKIDVKAKAGDDLVRIDDGNGSFTDSIPTTIDGGPGNDTIAGGKGIERLLGGPGNDTIDGNGGNDLALLGPGDDTFVWDPGDGSDIVEGQDGADTMIFNGAGLAEKVTLSRNGSRLALVRDLGNITMDTAGVETVDVNALGGADLVTVNDLTGTDVGAVNVDLAGTLGGVTGDGAADRVVVDPSNSADLLDVSGDASDVKVSGLVPTVHILHSEAANDRLELNPVAGTAPVTTLGLGAGAIQLFVNGVLVP